MKEYVEHLRRLAAFMQEMDIEIARYSAKLEDSVYMDEKTIWGRRQLELNEDRTVFTFLAAWDRECAKSSGNNDFVSDVFKAHERLYTIYKAVGSLTIKLKDQQECYDSANRNPSAFLYHLADVLDSLPDSLNTGEKQVVSDKMENALISIPNSEVVTNELTDKKSTYELVMDFLSKHPDEKYKYMQIGKHFGWNEQKTSNVLYKMVKRKQIRRVKGFYSYKEDTEKPKQEVNDLVEGEDKSSHPQPQSDEK